MNPMYAPDHIKADKVYLVRVGSINADACGILGHCVLYRAPLAFLPHVDRMKAYGAEDDGTYDRMLWELPVALHLREVLHHLPDDH